MTPAPHDSCPGAPRLRPGLGRTPCAQADGALMAVAQVATGQSSSASGALRTGRQYRGHDPGLPVPDVWRPAPAAIVHDRCDWSCRRRCSPDRGPVLTVATVLGAASDFQPTRGRPVGVATTRAAAATVMNREPDSAKRTPTFGDISECRVGLVSHSVLWTCFHVTGYLHLVARQ
jgi:hypothetical protein